MQVCAYNPTMTSGTVMYFQYSGANSPEPTISGSIAGNATIVQTKGASAGSSGASGYGYFTITTTTDLASGSCWTVTLNENVGLAAATQNKDFYIASFGAGTNDQITTDNCVVYTVSGSKLAPSGTSCTPPASP